MAGASTYRYAEGTVSLTPGSAIVNGVGTAWILGDDYRIAGGDRFAVGTFESTIDEVVSATQIRLVSPYSGAPVTAGTYRVFCYTAPAAPRLMQAVKDVAGKGSPANPFSRLDLSFGTRSVSLIERLGVSTILEGPTGSADGAKNAAMQVQSTGRVNFPFGLVSGALLTVAAGIAFPDGQQQNAYLPTFALNRANHTGSQATSTVTGLDTALAGLNTAFAGVAARNLTNMTVKGPLAQELDVVADQLILGRTFDPRRWGLVMNSALVDPSYNATIMMRVCQALKAIGGGVIELPQGVLHTAAWSTIDTNCVWIRGQGSFAGGTEIRTYNATGDSISFAQYGHMGISDCYITSGVRKVSGYAISFASNCFMPHVDNVRVDYHFNGILVAGITEGRIENVCFRYMHGNRGLNFQGTYYSRTYRCVVRNLRTDNPYPISNNGQRKTWQGNTAFNASDIITMGGCIWNCTGSGVSSAYGFGAIPGGNAIDAFTTDYIDGSVRWRFVCRADLYWIVQDSYSYSLVIDKAALINGFCGYLMFDGAATGDSFPMWCFAEGMEVDHAYGDCVQLFAGEGFFCGSSWIGSSLTGSGFVFTGAFRGDGRVSGARIVGNWQHGVSLNAGSIAIMVLMNTIGANSQQSPGAFHGIAIHPGTTNAVVALNYSGVLASGGNTQGYGVWNGSGSASVLCTLNTGNNLVAAQFG